jgi:glycosyltransferase involved in cell wall biosynthesis
MKEPMVSIIIPCFNAEEYISSAIDSALAQTYENCEVIVIDDGSVDKSLDEIKRFGGRIKFKTGPNMGASEARNLGIHEALGEWIQFLDADDRLLPDCVRSKLNYSNSTAEIVCMKAEIMPGHPESLLTGSWRRNEYTKAGMFFYGTPQTASPLYRKQDITHIGGFSKKYPITQEFDFHLRMVFELDKNFRVIDGAGVQIRPRPNSLSRSEKPDAVKQARREISETLTNIKNMYFHKMEIDCKDAFYKRGALLAREFYSSGDWGYGDFWVSLCTADDSNRMRSAYSSKVIFRMAKLFGYRTFERIHKFLALKKDKSRKYWKKIKEFDMCMRTLL